MGDNKPGIVVDDVLGGVNRLPAFITAAALSHGRYGSGGRAILPRLLAAGRRDVRLPSCAVGESDREAIMEDCWPGLNDRGCEASGGL